ncbi:hypothetical protein HMPREF3208_01031 [Gardnerella vaginalis]|uniref:Uncharacterized protein n=1 Tax=Gardnerella vaginalis TaxID=2702 RepID=A0A133NTK2_GARVA|nr:hypothetical protein HMPREF3208_01031 [Gardnerella vaginalis]
MHRSICERTVSLLERVLNLIYGASARVHQNCCAKETVLIHAIIAYDKSS